MRLNEAIMGDYGCKNLVRVKCFTYNRQYITHKSQENPKIEAVFVSIVNWK